MPRKMRMFDVPNRLGTQVLPNIFLKKFVRDRKKIEEVFSLKVCQDCSSKDSNSAPGC